MEHIIADLSPDTAYYAKLSPSRGVFLGDLVQWRTCPAVGVGYTRKMAIVCCQRHFAGSQSQLGWVDLLGWSPDEILFIGDVDYVGGQYGPATPWTMMLEAYTAQLGALPAMRQALARAGVTILEDDHAFSVDNGDSNEATDTGRVRTTNIYALQQMFPMYPFADGRAQDMKRSLSGSRMWGKSVRLIYLDAESLDRSLAGDADDPAKTFPGSEGDAFLRAELVKPAALNVIVCSKALIGSEAHGARDADQVWNYSTWRNSLSAFIAGTTTADGKPIQVYWWGADRHATGYASKTDNPVMAGHPALLSSGIEQLALDQRPGETYTSSYGYGNHTLDIPVVQYVQATVTDLPEADGAGTVTVHVKSREAHDTFVSGAPTDPASWTLVDGFDVTDTWNYTASPGELVAPWAGDACQTTVEITALTSGATSVGLAVSPNPDLSDATYYASVPPDDIGFCKWQVADLSPDTTYYYQFSDTYPGQFANAPIGDVYTVATLKPIGPITGVTRIAVGSCGQTAPMAPNVWDDMLNDPDWVADRVQHLGDFGYPGYLNTSQTTHKQNWAVNLKDPGIGRAVRRMATDYVISDHDVNGYHYESNAVNYQDATSQTNMDAWVAVVPARVVDSRSPIRARYRSEVEGMVRFIKLDTRSWDRTDVRQNGISPTSPTSTMLGATQLAWLQAEIDAAQSAGQLCVVFTDPAWNGLSPVDAKGVGTGIPVSYSDKWPSYTAERDAISDYAAARGVDLFIAFGTATASSKMMVPTRRTASPRSAAARSTRTRTCTTKTRTNGTTRQVSTTVEDGCRRSSNTNG